MHPHARFSTIGLTERDLGPVQFLAQNAQRAQQKASSEENSSVQLLFACATWINAFTQFKHLRRLHGLPTGKAATYAYGSVLAQLKMAGKAFVVLIETKQIPKELLPISPENFEACVRELQCDDVLLDMGLLDPDQNLDHIAAIFEDSSVSRAATAPS